MLRFVKMFVSSIDFGKSKVDFRINKYMQK